MRYFSIMIMMLFSVNLLAQSTSWNEYKLKEHWKTNGLDKIEGIYKYLSDGISYQAIIKTDKNYQMIYLGGAQGPDKNLWSIGDVKAYLYPTATPYLFESKFIMPDKSISHNFYFSFKPNSFDIIWTENDYKATYLKIYPTEIDNIVQSGNSTILASGTGFGISSNGIIITNYHVIDGAKAITVRGINSDFNKTYKAKVLVSDKNNDLALIQIDDYNFTSLGTIPFTIKTSLAGVGENIFVLGYPLRATMGDEIKLTNGIVSSKTGFQGDITSYQISAPVQPGNSGGPLFDNQGNLIGIINAKHTGAENASYGVKSNYLTGLLELLASPPKLQTVNLLTGKSLTQQVELVKKFVYIIETE